MNDSTLFLQTSLSLTPQEIVEKLDKFIIGQSQAKRAVAIALRNRFRRKLVPEPLRSEIVPKNILMIGPTGVGKTEIARRLAKLTNSPFIKIEATKFTEVGYVGRDVESIIRDLVELAIHNQKTILKQNVKIIAEEKTVERILEVLVGSNATPETQSKFRTKLVDRKLDDTEIEINVVDNGPSSTSFDIPGMPGAAMGVLNLSDIIGKVMGPSKLKLKKMTVKEAFKIIYAEESEKLIDQDKLIAEAIKLVESDGIVFLDEIDKISSKNDNRGGEVSREGVQRDLLPLIEGTTVTTKYGPVITDYILFIASGAFHLSKPSDLLPELQGRMPIRVELNPLTQEDMVRILTEPESSLVKQYIAMIATEGVNLSFTTSGIEKIAKYAAKFNQEVEDIGARRLHTILEKLLEEINFTASDHSTKEFVIDENLVERELANFIKNVDLAKFIL